MSLNVGQLLATVDLDDRGMVAGLARAEAGMTVLERHADSTAAGIETAFDEALSELPDVHVDANTSEADRELAALRERMAAMRDLRVGVDIDATEASEVAEALRVRLAELGAEHPDIQVSAQIQNALIPLQLVAEEAARLVAESPTIDVHAATGDAERRLAEVDAAARRVDGRDPHVDVHVDDHGSAAGLTSRMGSLTSSFFSAIGAAAGFLKWPALIAAAIPVAAGLAATLANIAPAAAVGATGVLAVVSAVGAIKLGTSGLGGAFKAAFAPAVSGGGGAAKAANQAADAQRNLARATQNAAFANKQAAQQTAMAERDLADAQRAALAAQQAVNTARHQAVRDLQDMNNNLVDAKNQEKDAQFAVQDAAAALAQAQTSGNPDQIARAQLAYDEAVQALREQQLQVQRLSVDTAAANKAGVEGSKGVVSAKAAEAQAVRDVQDKTLALANAQQQQARTAQQGLDQIRSAQEALAQAGAGGGGAGGVNALAAAMARLAPNARALVREVMALKPAWDSMRLDVQQRLFAGVAAAVAATAATVLPVLRRGLDATAGSLNGMALGALSAARNLGRSGVLGTALDGAAAGLHNLVRVPGQVVTAFGQIAAAGAPQFKRLTAAAGEAFDRISARLSTAFASGGMSQAIDMAVKTIGELGTVLGNIGHIIGSVFGAAQSSGGSFLQILGQITGAMATAFASPDVQAALHAVFSTMAQIGRTVAPLLVQALGVIAPVLTALGPPAQLLVRALGDALRPIIAALGPVLLAAADAVGDLVSAVAPLLPIVGQMIASLGPILTPILVLVGELFRALGPPLLALGKALLPPLAKIVSTLGRAFKEIAPILDTAMQQLGAGLVPVVAGLGEVVGEFVSQYAAMFISVLEELLPLVPQLIPMFVQFGVSMGQILKAVAPLLPQLMLLSSQFALALLPALIPLVPPITQLIMILTRFATDVITKIVIPGIRLLVDTMNGLRAALQPAIDAITWVTTTIAHAFEWLSDHLVGHSVIPDMVRSIVSWFTGLPGKVLRGLGDIAGRLGRVMEDAANSMIRATITGLRAVVSWISDLPGRAVNALGDLGSTLYRSGSSLIGGFIDGIKSKIGDVGSAVSSVLGFAKDHFPNSPAKRGPFSGLGWTFHSGVATGRDYAAGLAAQGDVVAAAAASLMGAGAAPFGAGVAGARLGGGSSYGGGSGSASGGGVHTVRIEVSGPEEVKRLIRTIVRTDGGSGPNSVQTVFG